MPFDTNMYGRIDMQTPVRLGALLDPANIERQRADQMATQDKIAQMQEQRTLRDLLSGAPDIQTAAQRLVQAGKWQDAAKLQGIISAQQQGQAKAEEAQRKQALEQARFAAYANPSDDAMAALMRAQGAPEEVTSQFLQNVKDPEERKLIATLPPEKWAESIMTSRKQAEANAATAARDAERYKVQSERDAEKYAQAEKLANIRHQGVLSAIGARQSAAPSGKPPAGYRFTEQGDLEAIPGGPADTKRIAAEEKARADAQKTIGIADQGVTVIDQLLNDKGLKDITGWASKIPIIPNTDQARADALAKQIEGQSFLQAFQSLKGGGAITNIEGEKATAAIARLQRGQKEKDYRAALEELKGIMLTAKNRASGGQTQQPSAPQLPAVMPSMDAIKAEIARRAKARGM